MDISKKKVFNTVWLAMLAANPAYAAVIFILDVKSEAGGGLSFMPYALIAMSISCAAYAFVFMKMKLSKEKLISGAGADPGQFFLSTCVTAIGMIESISVYGIVLRVLGFGKVMGLVFVGAGAVLLVAQRIFAESLWNAAAEDPVAKAKMMMNNTHNL